MDSGCTATVCGELWLHNLIDSLSDSDKANVVEEKSSKLFKFGDSKMIPSIKKVKVPIWIGDKKILLNTEVIRYDIPLLLSKASMKKANVKIDFQNDAVSFFGKNTKISFTKTGHYCINVTDNGVTDTVVNETLLCNEILNCKNENKGKIALKLHRQFGHPESTKLKSLLKDAKIEDEILNKELDKLDGSCQFCEKYKRKKPTPVVALPLARRFNETVAMDLKQYSHNPNIWFLHLIDHFTRYSASCVIKTKKKEEIVKRIFEVWIRHFGPAKKFLTDNGGEFCNDEFISLCENFNIRVCTTAAESPWSNGLVERHNGILGLIVSKLVEDLNCDIDIALAWGNSAKNSLKNVNGYSSNQLVFGSNPNFPNIMDNKLPALEGVSCSETVRNNLNAMYLAREEFVKNESSAKLAKALKSQVRTHNDVAYKTGDLVYFKRDKVTWQGPGTVIGQDGQQVLIKHGAYYVRVHPCNVKLKINETIPIHETIPSQDVSNVSYQTGQTNIEHVHDDRVTNNAGSDFGFESVINIPEMDDDTQIQTLEKHTEENREINQRQEESNESLAVIIPDVHVENVIENGKQTRDTESNSNIDVTYRTNNDKPKIKDYVECISKGTNETTQTQIISRAGKATGKYSNWYNSLDINSGEIKAVNWDEVEKWKPLEREEAMLNSDEMVHKTHDVSSAKLEELEKWKENKVYQVVPKHDHKSISLRWVISTKIEKGQAKTKGRLVARGFQEDIDIFKDSPTCSKEGLRIGLHVIASNNWIINSIDIKAAFLQSRPIERDVYVKPPPEAHNSAGILWKLNKTIYGLCDGSRSWYITLKDFLVKNTHAICCTCDPAIFSWHKNNELSGILCCHVDDIIFGGTTEFLNQVIIPLKNKFAISSQSQTAFKYIGLNIEQGQHVITLDQNDYIGSLKKIEVSRERRENKECPLNDREIDDIRSALGQLGWISSNTRPDLAFDICYITGRLTNPTIKELIMTNKTIIKAQSETVKLQFGNSAPFNDDVIESYHDASFGNLENGGSQGGFVVFMGNKNNRLKSPIMWQSRKIRRVVKSTMASETLACVDCAEASVWLNELYSEIMGHNKPKLAIKCFTDSKQLYEASHSIRSIEDKRLRIDMAVIREMIDKKEISKMTKIGSDEQLADCLTKMGASSVKLLIALSGLTNTPGL